MDRKLQFGESGPLEMLEIIEYPKIDAKTYFERNAPSPSDSSCTRSWLKMHRVCYWPLYGRYRFPGKVLKKVGLQVVKKEELLEKLKVFHKHAGTSEEERVNSLLRLAQVKKTLREAKDHQKRLESINRVSLFLQNLTGFFRYYGFWNFGSLVEHQGVWVSDLAVYSSGAGIADLQALFDICTDYADDYRKVPTALPPMGSSEGFEPAYY